MKITDHEIIKNGEKELIDALTGDLDWTTIEQVFRDKFNLGLQEDIEYKQGDIVIYNNQIAYRLDFDVKVSLSVLFDRKGEYLDLKPMSEQPGTSEETTDPGLIEPDVAGRIQPDKDNAHGNYAESDINTLSESNNAVNENVTQMASQIADMISEINQD